MTPRSVRRIGLFGGGFDPVHVGHVALAHTALQHLRLDELRWIPTGQAYHKARELTAATHRAAMLALALRDEPRFVLDRSELERAGPSYTVDTVRALQGQWGEASPAQWFLVIGQDQYAHLHTWHEWDELTRRVTLAVAARDGQAPQPHASIAAQLRPVELLPLPPTPVSSSVVRALLSSGKPAATLVPDLLCLPVADYIASHHLYSDPHTPH